MPPIRVVPVPETEWRPLADAESAEEMTPLVLGAIDSIIGLLTSPLTPEEEKPTLGVEAERTITVTGKDYVDAAEAVNQLFMERRWSDGMAIVPPTEEAVKRMLAGTSRSPDEVVGIAAPVAGKATVEKIAINAVMGGAKPEYLPVIITALEIMMEEGFDLTHLQNSLGGMAPVVVVSGPIAQELNINGDINLFGFGWRANATIGRSIRLNLINLGHSWPGINRMAMTGQPGEFTSWCFAEHLSNPFDPLPVDFGYGPTDSAVTVFGIASGGKLRNVDALGPAITGVARGFEASLEEIARGMEFKFAPYHFASYAHIYYLIALGPTGAANLAQAGWTKDDIRSWLYEHARVPYSTFAVEDRIKLKENIALGRIPELWDVEDENAMLPVVIDPDDIWITVAGSVVVDTTIFIALRDQRGTKVIHGATLTKAGR